MARLSVLLVVALLVGCAMADRYTILGRTSDPCADINAGAAGLQTSIVNNCQNTGFPQSATTIYIPSEGSGARVDPQITAGGRTVTIGVTDTVPTGNDINLAVAGQTTFLCLAVPGGDCSGADAVVLTTCAQVTLAPGTTTIQFTIPPTWDDVAIENEDTPRALCRQTRVGGVNTNSYFGLNVAVVFNCAASTDCLAHPGITQSGLYSGLNTTQARLLATRTVCCVNAALGLGAGICINTNVQTCCGGAAFEPTVERCCDVTAARIRGINQPCPCFGSIAGGASNATGCPATETCCLPTKFATEFTTLTGVEGRCYQAGITRCCNTGETYDPGAAQCCVINGIQSLNTPCPCSQDTHCLGSSIGFNQTNTFSRCCRQRFPSPVETPICTPFANFPSTVNLAGVDNQLILIDNQFRPGQNIAQVQRCPGVCVDTRFQMCCNGVACVQGYEKCCNSTCCNKFVGKCAESYRAGTPGSRTSSLNFNTPFQTCTIIENLGPLKTYWVFVLPTFLLVATLGSLALVIVYASSHTTRAFSFVERAIVLLAVLQVLLAIPLFFSPAYKYGITIVIVGLIAILSATARVWWLNVLAVGATIVLLLFLIDPFHGNWFFNFANGRLFNGNPDPEQMGILHTLDKMWTGTASYRRQDFCVQFYDYFSVDPLLNDVTHKDALTLRTFGFCLREWVAALLIIELFNILLALLIFVLVVLALTLRFRKVAPIPVAAVAEPAYVDLY